MPFLFIMIFAVYRIVFAQLASNARTQAVFGALWPMMKIFFKFIVAKLSDLSNNPDVSPFVLWCFDCVSASCGNLLFLSASDVTSVITMILFDICENMTIAVRVVFKVSRYRRISAEMKQAHNMDQALMQNRALWLQLEELGTAHKVLERRISGLERGVVTKEGGTVTRRGSVSNPDGEEKADREMQYGEEPTGQELELEEEDEPQVEVDLAIAVRTLLGLVASEASEIIASLWGVVMTLIVYHSPNKRHFFVICEMTPAQLDQALMFSGLDAFLELVTFVGMSVFLALSVELQVLPVALCYLRKMQMFADVLLAGITLGATAVGFLFYFHGVDPALFTFGTNGAEGDLRGCSWVGSDGGAVEGDVANATTGAGW